MGFKFQIKFSFSSLIHFSSCNNTDYLPLHIEPNQPNLPQQDSPIPSLPCKQSPRQLTPGLSGTQFLEDLFRNKQPPFPFLILTFASSKLNLPPFIEPSQHNEPPIPGPSQSSEPHEDTLTHEPEPEVALIQYIEEHFAPARPATPASVFIIDNTPIGFPPPSTLLPLEPSSPHSYNEVWQEFTDL
ncbi:hypothetical protein O181_026561 [Austropuccinia psidii MF-1]|uniref:Uncharacterized protein n=1 Tax=Austropuccinia psidii MF-1 TaxID=1389203 RepID=A0A9Q3CQP5_9BASI|nr:hypothetical protein [Austropuccinia psidii MF-1]